MPAINDYRLKRSSSSDACAATAPPSEAEDADAIGVRGAPVVVHGAETGNMLSTDGIWARTRTTSARQTFRGSQPRRRSSSAVSGAMAIVDRRVEPGSLAG